MKSKKILIGISLVILVVLALGAYGNHLFPFVLKKFTTQPIAEGVLAPQFELKTIAGEVVSLEQFKGRPVALKFWSSI